ncbi:hypothetical protein HQ633_12925, partial [Enterococcus faecium]|nr:hypothetical protein [Enterococcus faecium]
VTIPNNQLPGTKGNHDVVIKEPGKTPSKGATALIPAKETQTPTATKVDAKQDPTTGDVTLTPTTGDGKVYPEGTTVTIKGVNGDQPYKVNGQGQVTIPNNQLPGTKGNHDVVIKEPGKTPSKGATALIPAKETQTPAATKVDAKQDPTTGDVTLTPKDGAGQTYPEGSTVTVKGLNGGDKTYQTDAKGQVTIP